MPTNDSYNRAVKPLTITPVVRDTTVKRNKIEGSLVRHVKKLRTNIIVPAFSLEPFYDFVLTNLEFKYAGQYNFTVTNPFRISNFEELRNTTQYRPVSQIDNFLACLRYRTADNQQKRYKLIGYVNQTINDKVVPADTGNAASLGFYRSYSPAPWYNGELVSANFVLEIWRLTAHEGKPAFNAAIIELLSSRLLVPSSLEQSNSEITHSQFISVADASMAWGQNFPVNCPAGVNS